MRNAFQSIQPDRVRPALALVNSSFHSVEEAVAPAGLFSCDAAAALGLDPDKSRHQLWLEKTGRQGSQAPANLSHETSPGYWQTLLEPLMAAVYTKRTGHRLRRHNISQCHRLNPWMQATLGWEVVGVPSVDILECISVGKGEADLWDQGIPAHVRINVMHTLAVTGKSAANLAVLMCGQDMQIFSAARDQVVIEKLIDQENEFWDYVRRDEPPI